MIVLKKKRSKVSFVNKVWYESSILGFCVRALLLPFSFIFMCVTRLRRFLYAIGYKKTSAPPVPIVIVGGITVGGSGKSPMCIALLNELEKRGFKVGLLSRGYKSKSKDFPILVNKDSDPALTGDEPLLIKQSTNAIVVVDPKRVRGANFLYKQGVEVIICDDGLQHYALDRDVEIIVLDGERMLGNGLLMPAGPLREGRWRLNSVDAVVVNGALAPLGFFSMVLDTSSIVKITDKTKVSFKKGTKVCALAGIGNPERFYKTLKKQGFDVVKTIFVQDHKTCDRQVILDIQKSMPVIMTAKDAIKYDTKDMDNVYVLNVEGKLSNVFLEHIVKSIKDSFIKVNKRKEL